MSAEQLKTVAEQKLPDLLGYDVLNAAKEVAGTCVSLGVTIEGEDARTFNQRLENGEFDGVFDEAEAPA
jgi:large subunit ribosomal protein L11